MANFKLFDQGRLDMIATGLPATLYFFLCDKDVDSLNEADTLAGGQATQTAGSSTKNQAEPTPVGEGVATFTSMTWTETSGTPKSIVMASSAPGGGGKYFMAWNIDGGNAVDLAVVAPLVAESLSFKLAYETES